DLVMDQQELNQTTQSTIKKEDDFLKSDHRKEKTHDNISGTDQESSKIPLDTNNEQKSSLTQLSSDHLLNNNSEKQVETSTQKFNPGLSSKTNSIHQNSGWNSRRIYEGP